MIVLRDLLTPRIRNSCCCVTKNWANTLSTVSRIIQAPLRVSHCLISRRTQRTKLSRLKGPPAREWRAFKPQINYKSFASNIAMLCRIPQVGFSTSTLSPYQSEFWTQGIHAALQLVRCSSGERQFVVVHDVPGRYKRNPLTLNDIPMLTVNMKSSVLMT